MSHPEHLRRITYIFTHFKAKPGDYNIPMHFKSKKGQLKYSLLLGLLLNPLNYHVRRTKTSFYRVIPMIGIQLIYIHIYNFVAIICDQI